MTNEVELKLRINKSDIPVLKRQLASFASTRNDVQVSTPVTRKTLSIYYDTPYLSLFDHGLSLRLRHVDRKWTQTIKDAGSALSGLHQRLELEWDVKDGKLDFSKITDPAYLDFFNNASLRNALIPLFSTDIRRTLWHLSYENNDKIELVLDIGELIADRQREPICEIELELKNGNKGRLFELALTLQAHFPLWIENISKAQRAYAYFRSQPPKLIKATQIKLSSKASADTSLKQIVETCLMQLQGNQDMVLHGHDIEGVHQMRIAIRRLRAALKIFNQTLHRENTEAIIRELAWISNTLGNARDLDVFITQTLPPIMAQMPNQSSLTLLAKKAKQAKKVAYVNVREAISSQRYQHLLLTLGCWLENQDNQNNKIRKLTIGEIAQPMLTKRYDQLKKSGKRLKQDSTEQRHRTRITAKKLRYLAEFFASLYSVKKTGPFIKGLCQLQDQLGIMNDINVTSSLLEELLGEKPSRELMTAKHIIDGWNAHCLVSYVSKIETTWKALLKQKPFW
ncbi:MAG: CHAD domain-containing protein [Methylotenera sp.]